MQKNKYLYLEGLRGLLALIVVIHHFILLFYPNVYYGSDNANDYVNDPHSFAMTLANTPLNIFMNGTWAVCMFMLLSGFVLSLRYLESNDTGIIRVSFFKRYFRLAIPVFATVLIIFLLFRLNVFQTLFYPRSDPNYAFGKDLFTKDISFFTALRMGLFDVPLDGNNTYLPVFWTIDIEFIGVLLLFAFLLITHDNRYKAFLFVAFIVLLYLINKSYYILIMMGSLIAIFRKKVELNSNKKVLFLILFLAGWYLEGIPNLQAVVMHYTWYGYTANWENAFLHFQFISCPLIFIALLSSKKIQAFLNSKPLQFLGSISFSMYLLHLPILFIAGSKFLHNSKGQMNPFLLFIICLTIIVCISYIFFRLVDKNAIDLSNKIGKLATKKPN